MSFYQHCSRFLFERKTEKREFNRFFVSVLNDERNYMQSHRICKFTFFTSFTIHHSNAFCHSFSTLNQQIRQICLKLSSVYDTLLVSVCMLLEIICHDYFDCLWYGKWESHEIQNKYSSINIYVYFQNEHVACDSQFCSKI